jgi:GT2 family glycosyltransferase
MHPGAIIRETSVSDSRKQTAVAADRHRPGIVCLPDRNGRIDPDWLEALRRAFPASTCWARPALARVAGLESLDHASARAQDVLAAMPSNGPKDGLLVIRSGLVLPAHFPERLRQIGRCRLAPLLTAFPGNYEASVNPFARVESVPDPARLDRLVYAVADRGWTAVGDLPSDCYYLNADDFEAARRRLGRPGERALIDDAFVLDPTRPVTDGGRLSPAVRAAFGPVFEIVTADTGEESELVPYYGVDGQPVTLHISHSWGGGIARWIDDVHAGDSTGHHLVLCSAGHSDGLEHGQVLRLQAAGRGRRLLREFVLTPPIADTIRSHAQYRAILDWLLARYGIGRIVVSSLIGHSLDCLRTDLPTLQLLHDFYPATPLLDVDPLDYIDSAGRLQMQRALDEQRTKLMFASHSAEHWRGLRSAWIDAVERHGVDLLAPSEHVAMRWRTLFAGRIDRIAVQGHGFASPWSDLERVRARERADGRLTLVVVGRQSQGKGLDLLDRALDRLREHAQIVLVGAGRAAHALFGRQGVDIVLDYEREQLPALLQAIGPHAALFLSTVPETWNYVLSETRSAGLAPVATRVGSFPERIRDGVDGLLFEPTPDALVDAIAELAADPSALAAMAEAAPVEPGLEEAVARYQTVCPARIRSGRPGAPPEACGAGGSIRAYDGAELRLQSQRLDRRVDALSAEVDRRTDWAQRQQRLADERTAWARASQTEIHRLSELVDDLGRRASALEAEVVERTDWARAQEEQAQTNRRWAQSLEQDVESARSALNAAQERNAALDRELVERADWAQALERDLGEARKALAEQERERRRFEAQVAELERLQQELDRLRTFSRHQRDEFERVAGERALLEQHLSLIVHSKSWRYTRPIRFAARFARKLASRRAWNPLRWPAIGRDLAATLRQEGPRGTLARIHRQVPLPGEPPAAAPAPASPPAPAPPPVELPSAGADSGPPVHFEAVEQPLVSLVVPVFNKVELTAACLRSVAAARVDLPFEVIVVDDCSSDATPEWLRACQGIAALRNEANSGFIDSCNRGAASARGEFLVFLNNDTTVSDGWLDALIEPFHRNGEVGVVGARLIYPDGRLQEAGGIVFNDASGWNYGREQDAERPQYNFVSEADYVSGACLAVRGADFDHLGGFDTRFRPAYYEDTDLCFQIRAMGKRVVVQPAATVVHHEGATSGTDESSGAKRYQKVNREAFRTKWAEVLAGHPAPVPDFDRDDPVRLIRYRRCRRRMLLLDAVTPQPDHDSGSVRIVALMTLMQELGYLVSFMPENRLWVDGYSADLQQAGIEVLCAPQVPSLADWLAEYGRDLDLVVVSRHYILAPVIDLIRRHCPAASLVFDTVDLHFLREEREAGLSGDKAMMDQACRSREQELAMVRQADATLVVSPVEQALLADLEPEADVRIVSNIHTVHGCRRGWDARHGLMFVGGFQHVPNVDAALWLVAEIFPLIREQIPDVQLHLIGSRMPAEILGIERAGVEVHGFVRDLEPFLDGCRVSLAPLRYGAGVKGKVNQAMSHGLPVVATSCAAEGMFLEAGRDVLVADSAADFAAEVVRAHQDPGLWQRLSDGGLANVEQHFSRAAARRALEGIDALVDRRQRHG